MSGNTSSPLRNTGNSIFAPLPDAELRPPSGFTLDWVPDKPGARHAADACKPGIRAGRCDPGRIYLRRRRYFAAVELVGGAAWHRQPGPGDRGPGCAIGQLWPLGGLRHSARRHRDRRGYGAARPVGRWREARNDFGRWGYGGPCPPPGGVHHYHFTLLAISRPQLELAPAPNVAAVLRAAQPYVIEQAALTGTYHR